jgi:hypothetical protein
MLNEAGYWSASDRNMLYARTYHISFRLKTKIGKILFWTVRTTWYHKYPFGNHRHHGLRQIYGPAYAESNRHWNRERNTGPADMVPYRHPYKMDTNTNGAFIRLYASSWQKRGLMFLISRSESFHLKVGEKYAGFYEIFRFIIYHAQMHIVKSVIIFI